MLAENKKIRISPSILSADFSNLEKEIQKVETAGADMIHVDVMDGHFVPNITIGPFVVKSLRKITLLPLDVHLMIENPLFFAGEFADAGSDMITVHIETLGQQPYKTVQLLRDRFKGKNILLGISLNPKTALSRIIKLLPCVDFVLVMSVEPGFSGQKFMPEVVAKIEKLRSVFDKDIAIDGGINDTNAGQVIKAGATIVASGSYIFQAADTRQAIERIRHAE
jgi:ribulose-phosphate 3-epimerase